MFVGQIICALVGGTEAIKIITQIAVIAVNAFSKAYRESVLVGIRQSGW